ncbi:hypothetical protein DDZ13_09765 [Coraliomargarita sinensis]|uniref:ATPase BadF/BadG/BcrA/BcrD type domain-containing protein n=1 Tax=Coraliomargarita sinensis TaxID=2174842 RepID=A0A317ZHZ3_9BACT|nr:BadF/BadG/BcrA/BcrD ATPase family protein [Coraliomargarita sinensis]PXA03917.1 hypothetical protein DDZ13_09765 [Coraliomargarita sinensis]
METYLGIDGGGSKTRALLVDANGRPLHYSESGPSNLNVYSKASVQASLRAVIDECLQVVNTQPFATCLGLAGAGNPETGRKLEAIVDPLGLGKFRIVSDAEIALEGAFSGGPGILLIAGTGSVCLAKSANGSTHQCGGWGWLADDAGSAAWIGQRALEAAVQQNDGRLEGQRLKDEVFAHLEIKDSKDISNRLYQPLLERSQLAELAKLVLQLAENGDDDAQLIQISALKELEKLVRATARVAGIHATVALAGGLLSHNQSFRRALEGRLSDFTIQEPEFNQLEGAVAQARKIRK